MNQNDGNTLRTLLERLGRISALDERADGLTPTQWAVLSYLDGANEFSRAPSQVAEYMASTRGTISQTLKLLQSQGLVQVVRSETDKRWISYRVTVEGQAVLKSGTLFDQALTELGVTEAASLLDHLKTVMATAVRERGQRSFGICRTCRHHRRQDGGSSCALLQISLRDEQSSQHCFEHTP